MVLMFRAQASRESGTSALGPAVREALQWLGSDNHPWKQKRSGAIKKPLCVVLGGNCEVRTS